ncbi:MAG: phosphonate-binding protein, partial [Phenylobacterium sp.]|nr:phosphonate-binding protein [Phenylobacterium sp.]
LKPEALALTRAFAGRVVPGWNPPLAGPSALPAGVPGSALGAHGLRAVGGHAVPVESLERLDELLRAAPRQGQGALLSDQAREELGWTEAETLAILRSLGFSPIARPVVGQPTAWRRRNDARPPTPASAPTDSPFAALAALRQVAAPLAARRRRRKPKPKAREA